MNPNQIYVNEEGPFEEHLFKVLVVGDIGTGKTSLIKRYVHNIFTMHYKSTIGVEFALKVINWDPKTEIRLQLWDIAGQERFGNMTRVYYKEAVAAFVVFDVTRAGTFEAAAKWKQDIDSKVTVGVEEKPIPVILLANKIDLCKDGWLKSASQMDEFCKEHNFAGWFETSAKENIGIDKAARFLITKILENQVTPKPSDATILNPSQSNFPEKKESSCCK
mmetsp:Transcript_1019/g.1399  ORF Transcript_1019/g.1399 Transcript_1019/m.1399 type:complete len:220 (+) Transcript_1019:206-865(+)|eukprot:CAMPEP_0168560050 /NCGR_PEP_ID=MMETSP0413-20121227/10850_1 /TAXON_ID=136452 /ORGANISM="Filamoeba nolandi, Strain NC-AS-23-1" /LENGTH=219 /DNA_ID=CAMNT_0008591319 /DNA_START=170 /DNA_END=829 /DNA_ORIENTATION=+